MNIDEPFFDYSLDSSRIALSPPSMRGGSRLLTADCATASFRLGAFSDMIDYLEPGDLLVFNNSRVYPAKLFARKQDNTDGKLFDIILEEQIDAYRWRVLTTAVKRGRSAAMTISCADGEEVYAEAFQEGESKFLRFQQKFGHAELERFGYMPVPPYIERLRDAGDDRNSDRDAYQNIYAAITGSIAAPTAGFHFTGEIMDAVSKKGIEIAFVTLHVGYSTFKPVRSGHYLSHKMGFENYSVSADTVEKLIEAKKNSRRIIAVGTTSTRVLESVADELAGAGSDCKGNDISNGLSGKTDLYIHPGFEFKMVDLLFTNFHLPKSTLLLLVNAFAGNRITRQAYMRAIEEKFYFYSYGDSMLIIPDRK